MEWEKTDKLDILLSLQPEVLSSKTHALWDSLDDSNVELSASFYKRQKKIIHYYKRLPRIEKTRKILSRCAIFLLCLFSAVFLMIISVSALRNTVWETVVEWYDTYIAVHFESTEPIDPSDQSQTYNTAPTYIETVRCPTWFPGETEQEIVLQNMGAVLIDYYQGDEWVCSFSQWVLDASHELDAEGEVRTVYLKNGHEAVIAIDSNAEQLSILWNDGEYTYLLNTVYDPEEAVKMAESVQ